MHVVSSPDLHVVASDHGDHKELSMAMHGLGWIAFDEGKYAEAVSWFSKAKECTPNNLDYELALAWALTRTGGTRELSNAENIAYGIVAHWNDPSAHVCLGVIYYKINRLVAAKYRFEKALGIDPCHGSHTDLGALYARMGKFDETVEELRLAVSLYPNDPAPSVELGALYLMRSVDRPGDAVAAFANARSVDPTSISAAMGLAHCHVLLGAEDDAEQELRSAIQRCQFGDRWRLHLALARILLNRAKKQQRMDLCAEAYVCATRALEVSPDSEAEPHFIAGAIRLAAGALTSISHGSSLFSRSAAHHLRECLRRAPDHAEALRGLRLIRDQRRARLPEIVSYTALGSFGLGLMTRGICMSVLTHRISPAVSVATMLGGVSLVIVAALAPLGLVKIKAFKVIEAEFNIDQSVITSGPVGELSFGLGRLDFALGPSGQRPSRRR
jgi:Flp pilus assembly protein TadD